MKESCLKYACWFSLAAAPLFAQNGGRYMQTNLVSDVPGLAVHTDFNLINAWGIAFGGSGPWWVNAAGTSQSLVYDGNGNAFPPGNQLRVTIPSAGESEPTGITFNDTAEFLLAPGARAVVTTGRLVAAVSRPASSASPAGPEMKPAAVQP